MSNSKIAFTSQTYTTKANAVRGAKRAGHVDNVLVEARDDGFGYVVIAQETTKAPSYKAMYSREHSRIENPFNVVHSFLDANPNLKRKNAIAALVDKGVNFSTARTQYQRWFSKRKSA
jgi:hypothetical protein